MYSSSCDPGAAAAYSGLQRCTRRASPAVCLDTGTLQATSSQHVFRPPASVGRGKRATTNVQNLGTFKQGISKQGVTTFAWRPGSQYYVAATRGADSVLASDGRAQFGRLSTRRGCRICVTVRLPVRPRRETTYWQAHVNTPPPFPLPPPLLKCARKMV